VEVSAINVRDVAEIERAVVAFAREPNGGLIAASGAGEIKHREPLSHDFVPPVVEAGRDGSLLIVPSRFAGSRPITFGAKALAFTTRIVVTIAGATGPTASTCWSTCSRRCVSERGRSVHYLRVR
jgi:hypothetical protein